MKRGLGTILWAIDDNIGTNLQQFSHRLSENTETAITFCKKKLKTKKINLKNQNNSGRAMDKSDRAQDSTGKAQRAHKYA